MATLYDSDDVAWAEEQIEQLRALARVLPSIGLDIEHLIEELDGMARTRRREARSLLRNLIVHLLKLEHARDERPRRGWQLSADNARDDLAEAVTPTIRRYLDERFAAEEAKAREQATIELLDYGDEEAAKAVEDRTRAFTLDELVPPRDETPTRPRGRASPGILMKRVRTRKAS
jgi:hypothetical protein